MLICLCSFHLITSFLLIRISSFSVSVTIEKKCLTDNDCTHQLICNTELKICVCPKPYFWREDIQVCLGCAPGWLDLETNKCLLYAISHYPGVTWYQVETICKDLLAQSMLINSTNEFQALQHNIEYILNGETALAATLYFHQGAWIEINNEWIESYTWCNNDQKRNGLDCVQIRQHSLTNTICLQYVSCSAPAQFICEAKPLGRLELEKNIAKSKRLNISNKNEEIIIRSPRQVNVKPVPVKTPVIITTRKIVNQLIMTTKKPSTWTADHITSLATTGMQTASQLVNAFGNIFGKPATQPESQSSGAQSVIVNDLSQMPQALASNLDENSNTSSSNMLFYAGIGGGILLLILIAIIICIVCSKKKTKSTSNSSIISTESTASAVSYE